MSICWRSLTWSPLCPMPKGPVSVGKVVIVPVPEVVPAVVAVSPVVVVPLVVVSPVVPLPPEVVPPLEVVPPPPLLAVPPELPPPPVDGGGVTVCAWVVTENAPDNAPVLPPAS